MIERIASSLIDVWFMVAPEIFDYDDTARTICRIAGPVVAALSIVAMSEVVRGIRWAIPPFAVALLVAPAIGGGSVEAWASNVAGAAALMALTPPGGQTSDRFGGGWSALPGR